MKKAILFFIVLIMIMPFSVIASDEHGDITVKISSFRNEKGNAQVTLFNSAEGFPETPENAYKKIQSKIHGTTSIAVFKDMPFGEYAIAVLHDENGNGAMNRNMVGMPVEGNGASNNPEAFGPPKYEDAKFLLNSKTMRTNIDIKY